MHLHNTRVSGREERLDLRYYRFMTRLALMVEATFLPWHELPRFVKVLVSLWLIGWLSAMGSCIR